ncbi:autotransporter outer membrane beta-barrel domain-containing protein [Paralimibaculum aggregatum]|nr:autotransporter outer membrane beta-barrel domain-containing protein [Limibaculum sp. NKW23]
MGCSSRRRGIRIGGQAAPLPGFSTWVIGLGLLLAAPSAMAQIVPGPGPGIQPPDFEAAGVAEEEDIQIEEATSETTRSATVRISTTISTQVEYELRQRSSTSDDSAGGAGRRRAAQGSFGGGSIAAWVNGGVTFLENDTAGLEFDGELYNPLTGMDYTLPDLGLVAGLAIGYERSDLDTTFGSGRLLGDGLVVSPYVGKTVGEHAIVDAGLGYARIGYSRTSTIDEVRSQGDFNGNRFFAFVNATGYLPDGIVEVDGLTILGKAGFRYSREEQDAFTQGTTRIDGRTVALGQLSLAGEVRYQPETDFEGIVEFFARAEGNIDVIRNETAVLPGFPEGSDDRTDVTLSLGAVARLTDSVSLDVTYEHVLSREDISEQSLVAGLRINF